MSKNLMYHGTSRLKAIGIRQRGFKLNTKNGVFFTTSKEAALKYANNHPENIFTIDVSDLNIKLFKDVDDDFFDITPEEVEEYTNLGYDGIGLYNGTKIAVFDAKNIKIVEEE